MNNKQKAQTLTQIIDELKQLTYEHKNKKN